MKGLTLVAAAGAALVCAATAEAGEKTIRIGTEGAYPPYNYTTANDELVGFDIDIGNALCEAAEFDCEWVGQDWEGLIPALKAGKFDAIIASMAITDERKKQIDFTDRYQLSKAAVIGRADLPFAGTLVETVKGHTIGVQAATIHENYVREKFGDIATVVAYDTVGNAYLDLNAARIDFYMGDILSIEYEIQMGNIDKGFRVVGDPVYDPLVHGIGAGIAVRKGDDALRQSFNEAITTIRANGNYQQINKKYCDCDIYNN